jgi:hypothetical protein
MMNEQRSGTVQLVPPPFCPCKAHDILLGPFANTVERSQLLTHGLCSYTGQLNLGVWLESIFSFKYKYCGSAITKTKLNSMA